MMAGGYLIYDIDNKNIITKRDEAITIQVQVTGGTYCTIPVGEPRRVQTDGCAPTQRGD